ncbi:50S ribosomal protein L28 [Candidatus Poribacteria bacterium]|nr:50S ribosomal protein L28 [Candidatus Poribacteria bacterium]
MSKKCDICGKGPMVSLSVKRTGSKLRSGKKRYITGKSKRRQYPNIQKIKANIAGSVKTVRVCTSCLKGGKVRKVV